ncbi:MAG: hypothetical protein JXA13_08700 [Anaerolineales bacterium]|nr:hypothetical protein [Anaerolineales bacterium]
MKITAFDRILLLITALLAAYQVAVGIDGLGYVPITAYTIGFGVLLVACLLLVILGFEVLDSRIVVIISTIIPLSLSLGLVWEHLAAFRSAYLYFAIFGFLAVLFTRSIRLAGRLPVIVLAVVHGVAGLTIFLLPIVLAAQGIARPAYALVGFGGALIGIVGLMLSFFRIGRPILPQDTILRILPVLLTCTTAAFVLGFLFG